jgi:mannitol-1-phosphate 5-dehydrogenase
MNAVHFGAGNIGRGFIGEILSLNNFHIDFIDVADLVIDNLTSRGSYEIELACETKDRISVKNVSGINSQRQPEKVIAAIAAADIVTTAIGPKILPFIAELIAQGILARRKNGENDPLPHPPSPKLDIIACENMIGASEFLFSEVKRYIPDDAATFVEQNIGFPNAAVDRIVPIQKHSDPLFVSVEPFYEWVIEKKGAKSQIELDGVEYTDVLDPFIERKLFTVNSGHATVAYTGFHYGFSTIADAIADPRVLQKLKSVLAESGALLCNKWNFDATQHAAYINKIISRFQNPYISDTISRVARTPIRKLGFHERFIRPMRECKERGLSYSELLSTVRLVFSYHDPIDEESLVLQKMLAENSRAEVVRIVTGLQDEALIQEISEIAEN